MYSDMQVMPQKQVFLVLQDISNHLLSKTMIKK